MWAGPTRRAGTRCKCGAGSLTPEKPPAPAPRRRWRPSTGSRSSASSASNPYGTADDVAEFLAPYAAAGCTEFNLIPQSPDLDHAIAGPAAVKRLLVPA